MTKAARISKLRIGVLFGGKSIEREVSFNSGRTICDHIDTTEYEVVPIFQRFDGVLFLLPWHFLHRGKITDFINRLEAEAEKITWDDLKNLIDFMYIAVHGRFAEDGTVQGFLEVLGIPYLGSKVFGSSLGMNKVLQKDFLRLNEIEVAKDVVFTSNEIKNSLNEKILKKLKNKKISFPCIVKPVNEGSSFGISVVEKEIDLLSAVKKASSCDERFNQDVLIEEKLEGMEFVCVALQEISKKDGPTSHKASVFAKASPDMSKGMSSGQKTWRALPITQVIPEKDSGFFDYDQKYMPGRATKITPANCSAKDQKRIQDICIKASDVLNFSTISRIDGFLTKDGRVVLIDPNTLTGMGPATFLFHQAAEIGMSHSQLINYLIKVELKSYGKFNAQKGKTSSMKNKKTRVAVLLGGNTSEREISLESGRNICYKLAPEKYEVLPVFINDKMELYKLNQKLLIQNSTSEISQLVAKDIKINWSDLPQICDFVFIALHGGAGENGAIQGTLEMLGIPYNGSGVLASSLCMDKFKTVEFLRAKGFDVPISFLIQKDLWKSKKNTKQKEDFLNKLLKDKELDYPVIVKPHNDGCSTGVTKAGNVSEIINQVDKFFEEFKKEVILIEELIKGMELTCAVIGNNKPTALSPSKAVAAASGILSIEEKFLPGAGENITPAPLPKESLKLVQKIMQDSYVALGCKGYVRIDCFFQSANASKTKKDRVIILEINSLPGMTPATCIFHQAAEVGLRPMEFIDKIVEFGFENHKQVKTKTEEKIEKKVEQAVI